MLRRAAPLLILTLVASLAMIVPSSAHPNDEAGHGKDAPSETHGEDGEFFDTRLSTGPCINGMAGDFPCDNVMIHSFLPMSEIGGGRGSDVWGWTDPDTDRLYVIAGRDNGTAFIDVTNAARPTYLGNLPTSGTNNVIWRDIKVYENHAFIVAEAAGHGMQVFDLTRLRDVNRRSAPVELTADAMYRGFARSHNNAINEDTGFAYAVGSRMNVGQGPEPCASGLHMIDIRAPKNPQFAGCWTGDAYVHDTQCVLYHGPDARYTGRELCFGSNANTFSIVDVTDKADPVRLAVSDYDGRAYTHQGWLTEDHRHFLMGDEADESRFGFNTRTYIWDVSTLDDFKVIGVHEGPTKSIDHNIFIKGNYAYQSNYRAGFFVLALDDVADGKLEQVAYLDVYPPDDDTAFAHGTWSNYPFFDNGIVAVHGYDGLFIVRPTLPRT
jgi:choice-of-anchor B domain-containing protein